MSKTVFTDGNPELEILGTPIMASFLNSVFAHTHDGEDNDGHAPASLGPWIDSRDYGTLELANTAAVNAGKLLVISKNHTLTGDTTLTASVMRIPGGSFTKASTYTLTINGTFQNPSNGQCFIGFAAGNVTFAPAFVPTANPKWWGGDASGTLDSALAINCAEQSGAHNIDMKGRWGISSPIFLTKQLTVFDGGSRVGSEIYALAANISSGVYPNALFVNKINAWNGTIKSLRFPNNGVSWTGWVISTTEGGSGGVEQSMFSGHLYDLWVDPGTLAAGFLTGGFYDSWAHDIQFENIKVRFNCPGTAGNSMSGSRIYAITESNVIDSLVKAVNSSRSQIFGVTSYGTNAGVLIDLTGSSDFNISDINANAIATDGAAGLLAITSCLNIKLDNFSINRTSGSMKGIYISASELKAANGKIKGTSGGSIYSLYITGAGNDVTIDNVTVDTSQLSQIVTQTAGGSLVINNSKFTNSSLSILENLGIDTLNVTIQGSKLLNNNAVSMFIYASSGKVKIEGNDIGLDNATPTGTFLYYFTGSGQLLLGNNNIVGLGDSGEFHPSSSQVITFTGPNVGGTSFRSGASSPASAVTPLFLGEMYLHTTGNHWFKSHGPVNTDWTALN